MTPTTTSMTDGRERGEGGSVITIVSLIACLACLWIGYKIGYADGRLNGGFEEMMRNSARRRGDDGR